MTRGTVFLHGEGCFAIMAGATGFTFFHLRHSDLGFASSRVEYASVAITTLIQTCVCFMAKGDVTGIFIDKNELFNWMALGAV